MAPQSRLLLAPRPAAPAPSALILLRAFGLTALDLTANGVPQEVRPGLAFFHKPVKPPHHLDGEQQIQILAFLNSLRRYEPWRQRAIPCLPTILSLGFLRFCI